MRTGWALLGSLLLLNSGAGAKQKTDRPELKLTASVDMAAPERQPILVVDLVNESGHTLRLPEPPLLCKEAPGALSIEVKFTPHTGSDSPPPDCNLEVDGSSLPDIRIRAQKWISLKAGQDYEVRRPLAMGLDTHAHGTYELRVIYDGPGANAEEDAKLKAAGIAAPHGRFESGKVVYKLDLPHD